MEVVHPLVTQVKIIASFCTGSRTKRTDSYWRTLNHLQGGRAEKPNCLRGKVFTHNQGRTHTK